MRKFFEYIGILSLACFSFFFTEKTVNVLKESDGIMIEIKKAEQKWQTKSIDAIIEKDTIIPGIYGKTIDIQKSYNKMKRVGTYEENLLVYKKIAPQISFEKKYDKYIISGNPQKNMVTLLFLIEENTETDKLEKIIEQKNIHATFFIDGAWFEQNNEKVLLWADKNYTIGNLSYKRDYSNSSFVWMDTIIKKIGNQKVSFCYNEKEDKKALQVCSLNKDYTVRPTIIIDKYPLSEVKEKLSAGSIIAFPVNDIVLRELPVIIEYIKAKGYKIENLSYHLSETE